MSRNQPTISTTPLVTNWQRYGAVVCKRMRLINYSIRIFNTTSSSSPIPSHKIGPRLPCTWLMRLFLRLATPSSNTLRSNLAALFQKNYLWYWHSTCVAPWTIWHRGDTILFQHCNLCGRPIQLNMKLHAWPCYASAQHWVSHYQKANWMS